MRNLTAAEKYFFPAFLEELLKEGDRRLKLMESGFNMVFSNYCYAICPAVKDNLFIKTIDRNSDDAYDLFANWVYENKLWKKNPCFPRIFLRVQGDDNIIYLMEKLEEFDEDDYEQEFRFIEGMNYFTGNPNNNVGNTNFEKACLMLNQRYVDLCDNNNMCITNDLSTRNVMIRREGEGFELVITDPFGYTY